MPLRSLSLLLALALGVPLSAHAVEFTQAELARAKALQQRLLTLDSHLDTPANLARPGFDILHRHDHNALSQVDYPRMLDGALDGGFWAIYTDQGDRSAAAHLAERDHGLMRLVEIREMLAAHPDRFQLALTADDAADDTADNGPLLDMLGVDGTSRRNACAPFHVADDVNHVEFCDSRRFDVDPPTGIRVAQAWRDEEHGHVFVRLRRAAGTVDVLADLNFMKNSAAPGVDGLHDKAHRDLARYVLAPNYGKGTVWLVYGTRPPSLWQRVFHDGWPVWVPLLLALLGWLWLRAQRMGSLLPSPAVERRSLLEHVRASGEHLLRYGKAPLLYDAVRQAFLNRLRRRAPTAAALGGDARIHAIATLLQWSHDRVRIALQPPAAHDVAGLRDRIRLLIQMRNLL